MLLSELHPELRDDGRFLKFDLPCGHDGAIRVPINVAWGWQMTGELPAITLEPSLDTKCSGDHRLHFKVTAGQIVMVP